MQPAPTVHEVARGAEVVGQHDDLHAGPFCVGQHLGSSAAGVSRIFRVRVENGPVVMNAGQWGRRFSRLLQALGILVGRLKMGGLHAFSRAEFSGGKVRCGEPG